MHTPSGSRTACTVYTDMEMSHRLYRSGCGQDPRYKHGGALNLIIKLLELLD